MGYQQFRYFSATFEFLLLGLESPSHGPTKMEIFRPKMRKGLEIAGGRYGSLHE